MYSEQISSSKIPLIWRNCLKWNILKWKLEDWKTFLQSDNVSKKYKFRRGKHCCRDEPLWERNCDYIEISMDDFFEKHSSNEDGTQEWLYFDYKHIAEWFNAEAEKLDISWGDFGFPEKTAKDSTIWIGTKGAHTPCHMDTYGYNLVAQLHGEKRWFLFPPSETENMQPSRVPYEESSVYSNINFSCGCCNISGINDVRVVVLHPGDVLFVPFHWWHFVENLSTAISVNIWLPSVYDNTCRLEESLVKYFISSVSRSVSDLDDILNPNEDDIPMLKEESNLKELMWCLEQCKPSDDDQSKENYNGTNEVPIISSEAFSEILKKKCSGTRVLSRNTFRKDVINAFCHPDVIALVRKKLQMSASSPLYASSSVQK